MASQDRQIHKFVKDAAFTPEGESAIDLPGIVSVAYGATATTEKTQVANNIYHDESVTQLREHTATATFQDTELWDEDGQLYEGLVGAFTWKNEAHTSNASDETKTYDPVKIISISTTEEAGSGAQQIEMEMEVYSSDGTTSPFTKA